jgi:WD40 repeat protein
VGGESRRMGRRVAGRLRGQAAAAGVTSENLPGLVGGLLAGFSSGSQVAGYRLEEQIGAGGMAVVFRAQDERLGRQVALKLLAPGLAADLAFRQRFIRESRAAAVIEDPHIIPVYDAGEAGGVLFLAMRYVAGGDVRSLLARTGPLSPARAAAIISPVASALDAAHAAGLVHRDVKPANMLVDVRPGRPDHVYLSDFGLSKGALSSAGLTGSGYFMGTANYVAPEQIKGADVDGRADQYALACAAFELLAGESPFQSHEGMAVIWAHLSQPPPFMASRRPGLSAAVDEVFAKALAKAPQDRYASCLQFAEALRDALGLAAYHTDPGDILAADHPAANHPGTEIDWPAAPAAVGLAIPADPATTSTPGPALGRANLAGGEVGTPTATGPRPGWGHGQGTPPVRHRSSRRPGLATLAGISIVAAAGVAAAVILALSPTHGSASAGGQASASSHAHVSATSRSRPSASSRAQVSARSRAHGSASSPGPVPVSYQLADTLTDPRHGALGVASVAFSPDGKTVATGDSNGNIYLWDVGAGTRTAVLADPTSHGDGVTSVAFSPDGQMLATGDANGSTYVWNVASGTRTAVLTCPGSIEVQSVVFSPDGKTLATGDDVNSCLWPVGSGTPTAVLRRQGDVVDNSVAFSPDSQMLATGGTDGSTDLWDVATGTRTAVLTGPANHAAGDGVNSVAFSPDGKTLATGYYNGSIYLWDVATGTRTAVLADPGAPASGDGVTSVAFSPDGKTLATGDYDGSTILWDPATGTRIAVLADPDGAYVWSVAFSPDGKTLAASDVDGRTYLWSAG